MSATVLSQLEPESLIVETSLSLMLGGGIVQCHQCCVSSVRSLDKMAGLYAVFIFLGHHFLSTSVTARSFSGRTIIISLSVFPEAQHLSPRVCSAAAVQATQSCSLCFRFPFLLLVHFLRSHLLFRALAGCMPSFACAGSTLFSHL